MAESSSPDPFDFWRDLLSQMEKGVNQFANQGMKTDEFAKGASKLMTANAARKKITQAMVKRYCEEFNLPTRSDVEAVNERLQSLEDRLVEIATTLRRLADAQASGGVATGPARTRKPPPEPAAEAAAPARTGAAKRNTKRPAS